MHRHFQSVSISAALAATFGSVCPAMQSAPVGQSEPNLAPGEAVFDAAVAADLKVKRTKTGHLLVQPVINGRDGGWFIFDTGAGICVVSTPHVDRFDLTAAGNIDTVGSGGGEKAKLFRASKVVLGPLTLRDHPVMATDLSFPRAHLDEDIAGVIGFGVLSRCIAEIDMETPRIALHDPASFKLASATWTPLSLAGRVPVVTARFEGREGRFMLDSGGNSGVLFHEPAVRRLNLLEGRTLTDGKVGGVGGLSATKRGTIKSVELGGARLEDVPAEFALEAKGTHGDSSRDGRIGIDLLKRFVIYLDYGNERIALKGREEDKRK